MLLLEISAIALTALAFFLFDVYVRGCERI